MRVQHLLENDCDFQTARLAEALATRAGEDFDIEQQIIGSPLPALRRLRERSAEVDLIHAWSLRGLTLAALAGDRRLIFSPARLPNRRGIGWLRAMMSYRDIRVVANSATMQRALIERGITIDRCHLIRPGVDFSRIQRRRNPALREELGFCDDDFVILAAGESDRPANHALAVWTASILYAMDERYKLLFCGRGEKSDSLRQFAGKLKQPDMVRDAEKTLRRRMEFDELLVAADLVLVTASAAVPTLPVMIAMAAGLPIVSTVTSELSELLEDRHSAMLVPKPTPKLIAQRILDIRQDPSLQWSISDTARTEAYEFFPLTKFVNEWREIYRGSAVQGAR